MEEEKVETVEETITPEVVVETPVVETVEETESVPVAPSGVPEGYYDNLV